MTDDNQAQVDFVDPSATPPEPTTEHDGAANPDDAGGDKTPEQQEAEQQAEQKKHQTRAQKRIAELKYEAEQAKRDLEAYKQANPTKQAETERPTPDQYETWADYEKATDEWNDQRIEKAVQSRLQSQQPPQSQSENHAHVQQAAQAIRTQYADFDDVLRQGVERANTLPLPVDLDDLELPPEQLLNLAYTLSKDEDLYYELAGMSEKQAMLRLGQVVHGLPTPKPAAPAVSKAPPPIKPTSANASVARSQYEMSDKEFLAANNIR